MTDTTEAKDAREAQQAALRDVVAGELRTLARLSGVSAGTMADTILQRIGAAGFRWDQVPNRVYVAVTSPIGTPPPGYRYDQHVSVHRSDAGAQRALSNWANDYPEYRGFVTFKSNALDINE